MPTIIEDGGVGDRESQGSNEDSNFEQLMVTMLDERDKLLEQLQDVQGQVQDVNHKLKDTEKERDALRQQLDDSLPQVCAASYCAGAHFSFELSQNIKCFDNIIWAVLTWVLVL